MRPAPRALRLLAVGLAVAILPALGLAAAWPALLLFWSGAAVALGVDALLCPARRRLSWQIAAPTVLHVGAQDELGLTLRLPSRWVLPVEAVPGLSDDLAPQPPARGQLGRTPLRLAWPLVPSRRGVARIESLWLRYASPWGFWSAWLVAPVEREIPVLPNIPEVRAAAVRFFADRDFRAGLKIERYRGDGSEFDSLKEFLPGDDHRTMDWKATARHRRLLCRQHRAERNHQVILALDTGRLMSEVLGETSRLDHAINGALLLAYVCLKSGDQVGLFTFDSRVGAALAPVSGLVGLRTLVQSMARTRYSRDETNFTLGLTTLAQRLRRRSLVILLTDFTDTVTAELMLEHLGRIGRRHVVVCVSVRDPVMATLANAAPGDLEALGRAVVARDLLRDRRHVHLRLQRMGVAALDVPPAGIAPGLINQYLDIKRRERV